MSETLQVEWIQKLSERISHSSSDEAQDFLPALYNLLTSLVPLPPSRRDTDDHPKLLFSVIEAALYSFTVLIRKVSIGNYCTTC